MPRTVLVFHDKDHQKAKQKAFKAMETYWKAIEGTLDPEKVRNAVDNALVGDSAGIAEDARKRFHADDRLMLWFDFNNHDNEDVERSMRAAEALERSGISARVLNMGTIRPLDVEALTAAASREFELALTQSQHITVAPLRRGWAAMLGRGLVAWMAHWYLRLAGWTERY